MEFLEGSLRKLREVFLALFAVQKVITPVEYASGTADEGSQEAKVESPVVGNREGGRYPFFLEDEVPRTARAHDLRTRPFEGTDGIHLRNDG